MSSRLEAADAVAALRWSDGTTSGSRSRSRDTRAALVFIRTVVMMKGNSQMTNQFKKVQVQIGSVFISPWMRNIILIRELVRHSSANH